MVENLINGLSGVWDTISIGIQYVIHTVSNMIYMLSSLGRGIKFLQQALVFIPVFFIPIISTIVAISIIREIIGR